MSAPKARCVASIAYSDPLLDGRCWGSMKQNNLVVTVGMYAQRGEEFLQSINDNIIELPKPVKKKPRSDIFRLLAANINGGMYKGQDKIPKDLELDTYEIQDNGADTSYVVGCIIRFAATHSFKAYNKDEYVPDAYFENLDNGDSPIVALLKAIGGIPTYSFAQYVDPETHNVMISVDKFRKLFKKEYPLINAINELRQPGKGGYVNCVVAKKTFKGKKTGKTYYIKGREYPILQRLADGYFLIQNELGRQSRVKKNVESRY